MTENINDTLDWMFDAFGYSRQSVMASTKAQYAISKKRTIAIILRKLGFSYHKIGDAIGLHHTTVIHHCKVWLTKDEQAELERCMRIMTEKGNYELGVLD